MCIHSHAQFAVHFSLLHCSIYGRAGKAHAAEPFGYRESVRGKIFYIFTEFIG